MTNEQHITFNKWCQTIIGRHYYELSMKYLPLTVHIEIVKPKNGKDRKYIGGVKSESKTVNFWV